MRWGYLVGKSGEVWGESLKSKMYLPSSLDGSKGKQGSSFGERASGIWVWSRTRTPSYISFERSLQSRKCLRQGSGNVRSDGRET